MPKTFPIHLEVEEIALGTVLRRLNEMPGIAKIDLNLGHGGQGPGKKQLEHAAADKRAKGNPQQQAVQSLMDGPKSISEIHAAIGGSKPRVYGALSNLRKQGLVEPGVGPSMHQLTAKARARLGGTVGNALVVALPAPHKVKRGPSGKRATPGSGPIILREVLGAGPTGSSDLRKALTDRGMSTKSISGVLDRGRKHGLIKKNGADLYELTAKGLKIELGAQA